MSDILHDVFRACDAMAKDGDNYEERKVAKEPVDGLIISTAHTSDMGYETAIGDRDGFHPVERYQSRDEAVFGHQKWLREIVGMSVIPKLGYGDMVDACNYTLRRRKP